MLTWLIGKNENSDLLWTSYEYEITTNPDITRNINLFDDKNYKYIYTKKDASFFKQERKNSNVQLVIKGVQKYEKEIMNEKKDKIIYVDNLNKNELIKIFCQNVNVNFSNEELEIVKKFDSLEEINALTNLKKLKIPLEEWQFFFKKQKDSWYEKLKNNTLISYGILNPTNIIPVITYCINANSPKKPILLFINAKIKQGSTIWDSQNIWESCI